MDETSEQIAICVNCQQLSDRPGLDGWHIFGDGAEEEYALCSNCARSRATARVAHALFSQ